MKKAGIIGGLGPASTLDYYKGMIEGYRMHVNDENYPEILINSVNMTEMMLYVEDSNWDKIITLLSSSIQSLYKAGADFIAIASNTPHIVFDEVQNQSALPMISIVEETCKHTKQLQFHKPLIIGTLFTMRSGLYIRGFEKYEIHAALPTETEQEEIFSLFYPNLENGIVVSEDKEKMLTLVNRMIESQNADALVLGCTELPLMIHSDEVSVPLIDTTQIHIDSIVEYMKQ